MTKPKKGKVPSHLREFLFKKKSAKKSSAARRTTTRAAKKTARGSTKR